MKYKFAIIVLIIMISCLGTAWFMYHHYHPKKEKTIVKVSTNPKEDVKVGEIALEKIHKEVNLTSHTYDISYPFEQGTLSEDAAWYEKVKHAFVGRSIEIDVHASYELKSNLLDVTKDQLQFNDKSGVLSVILPKPTLHMWLNTEKTDMEKFQAVFAPYYTDEETMQLLNESLVVGKALVEKDDEKMEQAKKDMTEGIKSLFSTLPDVKKVKVSFQ